MEILSDLQIKIETLEEDNRKLKRKIEEQERQIKNYEVIMEDYIDATQRLNARSLDEMNAFGY